MITVFSHAQAYRRKMMQEGTHPSQFSLGVLTVAFYGQIKCYNYGSLVCVTRSMAQRAGGNITILFYYLFVYLTQWLADKACNKNNNNVQ